MADDEPRALPPREIERHAKTRATCEPLIEAAQDPGERARLEREMAIARIADAMPPFTDEQKRRLRLIIAPQLRDLRAAALKQHEAAALRPEAVTECG